MKVLVLGSGGRLGAAIDREFTTKGIPCRGIPRGELDFLEPDAAIAAKLDSLSYDVLINCAAITNVDFCESHVGEATRVNAEAPAFLAELCARHGAQMIHIGTDYVFDGSAKAPIGESAAARPLGVYGRSKLEGDRYVTAAHPGHIAVRVSWVFGPDRPSFVDAMLKRAMEFDTVEAVGDKWASPTYSIDCAALLHPLLGHREAGGVLHLCNAGATTWRDYAQCALDEALVLGWPLRARRVDAVPLASMGQFVAPRPAYSAMATVRYTHLTGVKPRAWQEAVRDYVRSIRMPG